MPGWGREQVHGPEVCILPYRGTVLQTVGTHTVMASDSWQRRVIHAAGSQNHRAEGAEEREA